MQMTLNILQELLWILPETPEIPNTAEMYPCSRDVKVFVWSFEKTLMILDTKTAADLLSFEMMWRL